MNKLLATGAALALLWSAGPVHALPFAADVAAVVDESGSMSGEHAWIGPAISSLETGLVGAGVGAGAAPNQYALVGFGAANPAPIGISNTGRGNNSWMSDSQFNTATGLLQISGGTEDGYAGINHFFTNYSTRAGAAVNVILVTDEDRDNTNSALTFSSILAQFTSSNALLNAVVDATFSDGVDRLLGIDSKGNGYKADGSGGFTQVSGGAAVSGSGTTIADYVNLALATGGAAWDLNLLRAGGLTADSFTAAFTAIKVREIQEQEQDVPEPASIALLGLGLAGLGAARRRRTV